MRIVEQFVLMLLVCVMLLFNGPHPVESAQHDEIHNISLLVAENRYVDNGDGTVTDTKQHLMWQKGDNGEEISFKQALEYCGTLHLGGYTDWRLPLPEELETAVVNELMMPRHTRDFYAPFNTTPTFQPLPHPHPNPPRGRGDFMGFPPLSREGGGWG